MMASRQGGLGQRRVERRDVAKSLITGFGRIGRLLRRRNKGSYTVTRSLTEYLDD